ncbi:MAG TPA: hypothetical protein VK957_19425 [Lunatimonas sp.]|nr:hypothetical protein [Lunatimonas sp.]
MKPLSKFIFGILVIPNLFMACGPVLYSNLGHNVPLLQEKGEFSGQVAYSGSDGAWSASGIGIHGAYSISDNVALISSFYAMKGDELNDDDNDWEGSGSYFELGGGLFGGDQLKMILYEAFAGIGIGGIQNQSLTNRAEFINTRFLKPFIQPSVAFSSRYFDVALTPRIAYLTYSSMDDFYFVQDSEQLNPREYFDRNNNRLLFEPGIMIRGGLPGIKLEIQYNHSTLGEPLSDYSLVNANFISLGLRFLISNRISQNKTLGFSK